MPSAGLDLFCDVKSSARWVLVSVASSSFLVLNGSSEFLFCESVEVGASPLPGPLESFKNEDLSLVMAKIALPVFYNTGTDGMQKLRKGDARAQADGAEVPGSVYLVKHIQLSHHTWSERRFWNAVTYRFVGAYIADLAGSCCWDYFFTDFYVCRDA